MRTRVLSSALAVLAVAAVLSPRASFARFENPTGKAGIFQLNLKLGAAIGIPSDGVALAGTADQFAMQADFGVALDRQRSAYLVFPFQFQVGGGYSLLMVPVGFQYDIPIPRAPGLYLYPRLSAGYAAVITNGFGDVRARTVDLGFVMPELGVKYVLRRRWNFGFEPFGLPIFFNRATVALNYRLLWYAGVNF